MQQLAEIKALCDILFDAKINSLASLQRVAVSSNDIFTTSADTFPGKIITTSVATITPYKIEFRAFTRELAEVLDGLARSSNCLIINNIEIKPAGLTAGAPSPPFSPPPVIGPGTPTPPARRGPGTAPTRGGATNTPPRGTTPPGERGPGMPPGRNGGGRRRGGMAGLEPAGPIFVAAPVTPPAGRAPPAPAADSGSGAPGTVLREQLLLIMISVEVVKFN